MKKLISVFAALALVGSLAAQKKKAPAKPAAPAAPAVAAPAAPAIAAPAVPAPAMGGQSGKGMGLFVEGRGSYTLGHGTSDSQATGDQTASTIEYKLANTSGFGGGATIGYEIASNLGLVASFDYRSILSRKWEQNTGSVTVATQRKTETMVLGLGLRPSIAALGGTVYAGMGFAYVLPFKDVTTSDYGSHPTTSKVVTTAEWNAGIGAYGELGYNYSISDMLYVGLGFRVLAATANNDGKKQTVETTANSGTVTTATTDYAASDTAATSPYKSNGITDMSVAISVGARF